MPRLTSVIIWPTTGKAHKQWEESPEADSFIRTSRRVSEAFRKALEKEDIRARSGRVELYLESETAENAILVRVVEHGVREGPESGSVTVSRGFHTLDEYTRAFFVADALQAAAHRLGDVHGWDTAAIDRAMDRVRVGDYRYEWVSEWRPSPDASTRVRVSARLLDDGFGRLRFEFARADEREPHLLTSEVVVGTGRGHFRRFAESIGWIGNAGISATARGVSATVDATTGAIVHTGRQLDPRPNAAPSEPSLPLPRLYVEDPPPVSFTIGGGPMNKIPPRYSDELDRLFEHVASELDWVSWWLHAGVPCVELEYEFEGKEVLTRVEADGDVLRATLIRGRKTIPDGEAGVVMARQDVIVLLTAVRLETGLGEHPPLPL